jgi:hypothetical protein
MVILISFEELLRLVQSELQRHIPNIQQTSPKQINMMLRDSVDIGCV